MEEVLDVGMLSDMFLGMALQGQIVPAKMPIIYVKMRQPCSSISNTAGPPIRFPFPSPNRIQSNLSKERPLFLELESLLAECSFGVACLATYGPGAITEVTNKLNYKKSFPI